MLARRGQIMWGGGVAVTARLSIGICILDNACLACTQGHSVTFGCDSINILSRFMLLGVPGVCFPSASSSSPYTRYCQKTE